MLNIRHDIRDSTNPGRADLRATVFITHAAPEDNEFALWISSKLAMAGYRVWVDKRRLHGGDDFWDEIDRVLRNDAIKQVVVFSHHTKKPGVKKELAIGDIVGGRLADPKFVIPIRTDDVAFADAPPEFIRTDILNAHPDWHDCLKDLFEALEETQVPKEPHPDAGILRTIIEAREDGRRFVIERPELTLTNWFPITPPQRIRYYQFNGTQDQMKGWLDDCSQPYVPMGRLAGTFFDPGAFALASSFMHNTPTAYDILFEDFISGKDLGPYTDKSPATNDVVNLVRQHFADIARTRGLLPVEFANKEVGWFFPDGLIPNGKVVFTSPDGRRIGRVMSGKFKSLRWHVCLTAKPRIWPTPVYRIHANVVLSKDGRMPLPGDKTHQRRRRLTKSWWNDVWRDRLLAAVHFLGDGSPSVNIAVGNQQFSFASWPLEVELPVSYDASDPPMPREEDDEGTIIPSAELDEPMDDLGDADTEETP
jgi:hypothetical protein